MLAATAGAEIKKGFSGRGDCGCRYRKGFHRDYRCVDDDLDCSSIQMPRQRYDARPAIPKSPSQIIRMYKRVAAF